MVPQFFISGLRKFGNLLVSLFPGLAPAAEWVRRKFEAPPRDTALRRWLRRVRSNPRIDAFLKAIQGFYWRNYAKDRVDWTKLTVDEAALLRPPYTTAIALCLLLPFALWLRYPAIPAELLKSATSPVGAWSVFLWCAGAAVAWGWLLVGSARMNRPAFAMSAVVFLYFYPTGLLGAGSGRWYGHAIPAIAIFLAASIAERSFSGTGLRATLVSLLWIAPPCALAGFVLVASTPLASHLPGPPLAARVTAGCVLGVAAWAVGRWARKTAEGRGVPSSAVPRPRLAWIIGLVLLIYLVLAAHHSGVVPVANATLAELELWTGYMWPLWYFIGVAIIYKLLGQTRLVTAAAVQLVPPRLLTPLAVLLGVAGAAVLWCEAVLTSPGLPWPALVVNAAAHLYHACAGIIWSRPPQAITALMMRWVLLFDVLAFLWLSFRRRLNAATVAPLIFFTVLAWLVTGEYVFESFGFNRSPTHSNILICFFVIWTFWLVHQNGFKVAARDSHRWPRAGRIAFFGGMTVMIVLCLHARATVQGGWVFQEVFFYLFRGVLDVGLPFFLYVYASRRLQRLPVPVASLLAAFCLGALFTFPLNVLDKLVQSGSWPALWSTVNLRFDALMAGRSEMPPPMELPFWWLAVRAAIVLLFVALIGWALRRRLKDVCSAGTGSTFLMTAIAMGIASFARAHIELPLIPPRWMALVEPDNYSVLLDSNLIANYLSYALPALLFGSALGGIGVKWVRLRTIVGFSAAWSVQVVLTILWPRHEPWLRTSGLVTTIGVTCLGLLAVLIALAGRRAEAAGEKAVTAGASRRRLATAIAGVVLTAIIVTIGWRQVSSSRLVPHEFAGWELPLPACWQPLPAQGSGLLAAFRRQSLDTIKPVLLVSAEPLEGTTLEQVFSRLLEKGARELPGFEPLRQEHWDRFAPGSLAITFTFQSTTGAGGSTAPLVGTTVLLPNARGQALVLTALYPPSAEDTTWDLAWATQRMGPG